MSKKNLEEKLEQEMVLSQTYNPLLKALQENDKKNLFKNNVITFYHKTGFPLYDFFLGSVVNIHDKLGKIIKQEPRIGQAAGTFNLIVGGSGSGKAQPMDTKIPTPNGYTLMKDIKVGDHVFDECGVVQTVMGVYPQGVKEVYEITFSDKRTSRCCKEHLWEVYDKNTDIHIIPLEEIMKDYKEREYQLPLLSGYVQYNKQNVPVDPYLLGLLIGYGEIENGIDDYELSFVISEYYVYKKEELEEAVNLLINNDYKIPDVYIYNSYDVIYQLIKGIVDMNGFELDVSAFIPLYELNESVEKQLTYIMRSLSYNARRIDDKLHLIVPIEFKDELIGYKSSYQYEYFDENILYIEDIKLIEKEECQCIKVSSDSELYLTEDFIVTHNTTFASQLAGNIIRQYKTSTAIHFDCEQRLDISRCETITKLPSSYFDPQYGERYMIKAGLIGLDTIQEMIVKLYTQKMKLKKELEINTGIKDEFGKDVKILEPSVIVIDSITTVMSETFSYDSAKDVKDAESLRGNTEGARDAKTIKGFFKDVLPLCKEANIIIFAINHINSNMSMNAFTPVAKSQLFLKQDESIPGGKTMIYYPFNIIKLIGKPSDNYTKESDGFEGHDVIIEPIKSSSNQSGNSSKGRSFTLIFDFQNGFDSLRSIIEYGKEKGLIEGTKNRLKFKDDDSFAFSWKGIYQESKEKPIWDCIKKYIIPEMEKELSFIDLDEQQFDDNLLNY